MPDGPEQKARDKRFGAKHGEDTKNPDKWSDPSWQEYAWGTDVRQDALNYISRVQPFSLGNLGHPLLIQSRPTFPFVQAPPRKHGPQMELRYGPLISGAPLNTDNEQLEQTLPQPVSRCHNHEEFGLQTNTANRSSHSVMENSLTPERGTNIQGRQHTGHSLCLPLHQEFLRSLRGIYW
jgi:hypothetical protein